MIKQDFISKYIQELSKTLSKILALELSKNDDGFLIIFNQMLQSFYKINDNHLDILLEKDEERDQFLFSDELRKKNLLTFMKAIRVYLNQDNFDKAKSSYNILKRIENTNTVIFQFPTDEDVRILNERKIIEEKINNI